MRDDSVTVTEGCLPVSSANVRTLQQVVLAVIIPRS